MEFMTVILLAFICTFDLVVSQPVIDLTSPLQHHANVGSTIRMECKVKNVGSSTVTWKFLKHDVLISSGYEVFPEQGVEARFSIQHPADSGQYSFYTLVITGLQEEDQGHYKCAVTGTDVSSVHSLNITEAPPPPTVPDVSQNFNFTDCCVAEKVSSSCMPACNPYSVDISFDASTACDTDLLKILKCASEGKNHAGCCKRRLVPNKCLDLCLGKVPPNIDDSYLSCLSHVMDIFACVEQGRDLLPSPPVSVSAVATSQFDSILVTWQKPLENGDIVTFYRIHYKVSGSNTEYYSTPLIDKHDTLFSVSNLLKNTEYVMYVNAITDHGSSQPSEFVYATTRDATSALTKNETIYECCGRRAVHPECQKLLCKADVMSQLNPEVVMGNCSDDFNNILACYAGERDQSACCGRMHVPEHCFSFCGGSDIVFSWNITQCIMRMAVIDGCIEEGRDIIPRAPTQFKLVKLEWNTAEFSWEKAGTAVTTSYDLFYRPIFPPGGTYQKLIISGNTEVVVSGLQGLTQYEAFVVAKNANYTSLPTSPIGFLTYAKPVSPPVPTPSTTPDLFYNFTACCAAKKMPAKCLPLCDYEHYKGTINFALALECGDYILPLLICGSDGRNHESCCKTRGVLDKCIPLCSVTSYDNVPNEIHQNPIMCAGYTLPIAQCYTEGNRSVTLSLPMAPESVKVMLVTAHSIQLSWDPPRRGPNPQNYTVLYQMEMSETWKMQTATKVPFNLVGLKDETRYSIKVVSVNENGTSVPSYVVIQATLPYYGNKTCKYVRFPNKTMTYETAVPRMASSTDTREECESACNRTDTRAACVGYTYDNTGSGECEIFLTNDGAKLEEKTGTDLYRKECGIVGPSSNNTVNETVTWANRTHCCQDSGISDECQAVCMMEAPVMSPLVCEMDFNKVLACVADGRDHTRCCRANGVPTPCLGYCQGQALPQDAVGALCLSYVDYIVTCFSQDCCQDSGISDECQAVCMMEAPVMSPLVCEMDFNKVLACVADGRDHTRCCRANGVPTPCLGYCQGQALPQDAVGALCLSYVDYIVTCFSQGLMNLPSPPQQFKVIEKHARYILVSWSTPKENCPDTDCFYVLQHINQGGTAVKMRVTETLVNITNLAPETQYTISVTAYNKNGSSLPAPQITITTFPSGFMDVSVYQSPQGVVSKGQSVKLICDAYGSPTPTSVYWILNNQRIQNSRTITVTASTDSEGLYKCTASVPNLATSTKSLNLNVRYSPTMSQIKGAKVPNVDMGYSATLQCSFRGFPTTVNWYQDDKELTYSYRRSFYQHPDLESHELRAELHILLVRDADLGKYTCEGSNQFGAHNGTVQLKKEYSVTTPPPTITPTPAVNVSDFTLSFYQAIDLRAIPFAVRTGNITGDCMDLCSYRVDLSLVVQDPVKYTPCIAFFEDYVTCATDGKDHTQCCKKNGVSTFCQDFCGNVVPDIDDPRIYECVDQVEPILNCVEEGLEKIPSQPLNVVALLKGQIIEVNWDPPADKNTIDLYQVWYRYNGNMVKHVSVTNTTHTWSLKYPEITAYRFWVIAKNKAGQSLPGYARNLTIRGIPPSEPLTVKGTLKDYNDIMLTWMPPLKGPAESYTVYYSTKGASNMQTTTEIKLILTDLNYATLYSIQVSANNGFGRGSNSTKILVLTKNAPKVTTAGQKGGPNAGVVVGVIIVILVVVAAAVLGFLFIRKRGGLKSFSRPDSVAFENPQYGVPGGSGQVQISGLPERSPDIGEQTNFDYCPLKEDSDIDPYSTAATLNVDQVGLTMNH
ncbi:Ig-like and fibronectin type-III domain-containing protein 2 [Pecten maximus]|uniref:Ig-like and fibronectin type-III domain-containing protein 2 n=1 Tax=Pecten maximus TaxID=6579 RepID=UPI00145807F3|nr:Ig-like and fibronectin type-III domain-containing protein 2 [Pecten maximus]